MTDEFDVVLPEYARRVGQTVYVASLRQAFDVLNYITDDYSVVIENDKEHEKARNMLKDAGLR